MIISLLSLMYLLQRVFRKKPQSINQVYFMAEKLNIDIQKIVLEQLKKDLIRIATKLTLEMIEKEREKFTSGSPKNQSKENSSSEKKPYKIYREYLEVFDNLINQYDKFPAIKGKLMKAREEMVNKIKVNKADEFILEMLFEVTGGMEKDKAIQNLTPFIKH
jgi:hypothetical protein